MTDNIDEVIKAVAKLETKATGDMVRESRKAMRREMNSYKPFFKSVTPKKSGKAKTSVKLSSKS